jgi:hypothetical protein
VPGSSTTPGRPSACVGALGHIAFRYTDSVGTRNQFSIAAQWLACTFPCRRFADILADACARLGADVVRYSFIVVDLHHLLLAGLPAHPCKNAAPRNRSYPSAWRAEVLGIIRERYPDFGPTLAAEKLAELHGIHLGRETLRQWMIAAGLWKDRRARLKAVHQPRYRRDCFGELIQIDGSEHWWFEGRGPQCTLLVYIDDATSRLMHLQFVESESTFDYFAATRAYLERYGKPVAFYSDKHGVFRVNKKDAVGGDGMTQFGRALHALNIDIICANSSQAKGPCRTRQWHAAGPVGQGDAIKRHRYD